MVASIAGTRAGPGARGCEILMGKVDPRWAADCVAARGAVVGARDGRTAFVTSISFGYEVLSFASAAPW
jgi:hypothetical protein